MGESFAGRRTIRLLAIAAGLGAAASAALLASFDGNAFSASWALAKEDYDPDGGSAMLSPANDTRINLMLLAADRNGLNLFDPKAGTPKDVLFGWGDMEDAADPSPRDEADRCRSNEQGAADFVAAVQASRALSAGEKASLSELRRGLKPDCGSGQALLPPLDLRLTPLGGQFAEYVQAAAHFYAGSFEEAGAQYRPLVKSSDPWLREASLYMVARSALNEAQASSFDEYGSLAKREERDQAKIAAAGQAFQAYIKAYPRGRYTASAVGLMRRVHWLAGDQQSLAADFGAVLAAPVATKGAASLAQEVDYKLLTEEGRPAIRSPLLLAVTDLYRMRCMENWETKETGDCFPQLGRPELEAQRPVFAGEPALFEFLLANQAFYVAKQPREVLRLIPDAAHQQRFTYLQFSRQMLRGLALEAVHDPNTRGFWLSLLPGADQPYQRGAVELALAMHDEKNGGLGRVFAPGSEIRSPVIRQVLLEQSADKAILRGEVRTGATRGERERALYILLGKELRAGDYADFLADVRGVPADANMDNWFESYREIYGYRPTPYEQQNIGSYWVPPLGKYGPKARVGEVGCPALSATVQQLAANRNAPRPRLCLAEYFRTNGFDDFAFDRPDERLKGELGGGPSRFGGAPYDRLAVYREIMSSPAATADDKAFALNRAIRCYAPSGNNSCGASEADPAQRKAWFQQLKSNYPNSTWAKSLAVYW